MMEVLKVGMIIFVMQMYILLKLDKSMASRERVAQQQIGNMIQLDSTKNQKGGCNKTRIYSYVFETMVTWGRT